MNIEPAIVPSKTGEENQKTFDLLVIGGGINGCGIARDAVGRGLSVMLCEKDDLAQATSSSSTKLFHGGLRYLEFFKFRLVREALMEREVLLKAMPHISWPMRFVLPYDPELRYENDISTLGAMLKRFMPFLKGRRPAWLIRAGLFVYDNLGGRKILPGTRTLNLKRADVGKPLKPRFDKAFEYSDCWVEDSRLVVLNARDAAERGADVRTRTRVESAERRDGYWDVRLKSGDREESVRARGIVNAGGPWVEDVLKGKLRQNADSGVRLVRGSHIVTSRLFDHDRAYFFQLPDGRIIFAIPYETDFTLIGTTDHDYEGDPSEVVCTPEEKSYLLAAANRFFERQLTEEDVVWTYSGVRPLYDDHASDATSATRDYVLTVSDAGGETPLLNVFGGKITTYRRLAEASLAKMKPYFPSMADDWTAGAPLPGGDFPHDGVDDLISRLCQRYTFLGEPWARRLVKAYGTDTWELLGDVDHPSDLGTPLGATLTAREVGWLVEKEWAHTGDDVLWRRSKLGLRLDEEQRAAVDKVVKEAKAALTKPLPEAV